MAIGWLYNTFARWLFRIRLRDIDCDLDDLTTVPGFADDFHISFHGKKLS
jgi:hypothetical protein